MKPDINKVVGMRHGSYDKLNDKGYVPEETTVYNGDIIMAKLTPIQPVEVVIKNTKIVQFLIYLMHLVSLIKFIQIFIIMKDLK